METILNLAWALCSAGLVMVWLRTCAINRTPRRLQVLSLAMVVLLLLPVISLSDDIVAAQSPAEPDSSLRRATHPDEGHHSLTPTIFALPEPMATGLTLAGALGEIMQSHEQTPASAVLTPALDSRPPPVAAFAAS